MIVVVVVVVDVDLICVCRVDKTSVLRPKLQSDAEKLIFTSTFMSVESPPPHTHTMFHTQEVHTEAGAFSSAAAKPRHSP